MSTAFTNGEVRPISVQSTVVAGSYNIYAPQKDNRASISSVNINSTGAFAISLYRYTALTNKKVLLYTFSLSAGSVIDDSTAYHLIEGDFLTLVVLSGTVNYSIEGQEYQKNCINPPFGSGGTVNIVSPGGSSFEGLTNAELRAEPVPISGTVTVDTSLLATSEKQNEQTALITTLNSLIETNNYLIGLLAPLAGAMNSGNPALRTFPIASVSTAVTGTVTATVANATIATFGIPASVIGNNQVNLLPALSNINNMTA